MTLKIEEGNSPSKTDPRPALFAWSLFFAITTLLSFSFEICTVADYTLVYASDYLPLAFYFIVTHSVFLISSAATIIYGNEKKEPFALLMIIDFCVRALLAPITIFFYSVINRGWIWDISFCMLIPFIRVLGLVQYTVKYDKP